MFATSSLLIALAFCPQGSDAEPIDPVVKPPNILFIIADDFGVDQIRAYREGDAPCTPNLDLFAEGGLLFRNAYSNPLCSPARASLWTGRQAFRTEIGTTAQDPRLDLSETIIPDLLPDYANAYLGKWHIGGLDPLHPNDIGWDTYAGALGGGIYSYYEWPKTVNGLTFQSTTYATTDLANDAGAAVRTLPEPWLVVASFNAPHSPFHAPPANLCPTWGCEEPACGTWPHLASNQMLGRAMIEAMDTEIGRVLRVTEEVAPNTIVIFLGDNGTAATLVRPPFVADRAKGTVYEGGVNVPLVVRGPGIPVGECEALVHVVDLFATISELGGNPSSSEDSISIVPYFTDPLQPSLREFVYSEWFSPNGPPPYATHERCVREERYKLIRQLGAPDEFYDLDVDPMEWNDLMPHLTSEQQAAYDRLAAELLRLGVD